MAEEKWKTAITKIEANKIVMKGYRVEELMGQIPFSHAVFLLLKGELPSKEEGILMDAMLVSSVDHGVTPPSALAARTVASGGAPLTTAVAGGIMAINRYHGGAIEGCMRVLLEAVKRRREGGKDAASVAGEMVDEYRAADRRIPGYGHRVHTEDPRSVRLFALADEFGMGGEYVEMAHAIRAAMKEKVGRDLPMNVDGAIATVLCEMDFPPEMSNGIFAISRSGGLVAQVFEEQTRMRPMRRIDPVAHEYDGPPDRKVG
jgi:citrate synthase